MQSQSRGFIPNVQKNPHSRAPSGEPAGASDAAVEGELIVTGCSGLRGTFKGLTVLPPAASLTRVDFFFQFGGFKSNIGKASLCLRGQFTFL